mgnify:CR=1 FL=1
MKVCELCGKTSLLKSAIFEGRALEICDECAELYSAIILEKPQTEKIKKTEGVKEAELILEEK